MLSLAVAAIFAALDRAKYFQTLDVLSAWSLIFFLFFFSFPPAGAGLPTAEAG